MDAAEPGGRCDLTQPREQQHWPARRRPMGRGDHSPKLTGSAKENQHLNWEVNGDLKPARATVRCGWSEAAATPPAMLPRKQRIPKKSAARQLAPTGGCIHTHTLSLSLLLLSASKCNSKDGGEEGQMCSGMSGKGTFYFLKVTWPHKTLRLLLSQTQPRGHTCLACDQSATSALTSLAHCLSGHASSVSAPCSTPQGRSSSSLPLPSD